MRNLEITIGGKVEENLKNLLKFAPDIRAFVFLAHLQQNLLPHAQGANFDKVRETIFTLRTM